jgi:hypothetical protein
VAIGVKSAIGGVSFGEAAIFVLFPGFLLFPLAVLSFSLPAFRVDERGVWQRWYWRWDLWPWEAFAGGLIRHTSACYGWEYPDKPWYSRTMDFSILNDADRDCLLERVLQVWKPPPVEVPEEIKLRSHGLPNMYLRVSPRGVVFAEEKGDPPRLYRWSEILRAPMKLDRYLEFSPRGIVFSRVTDGEPRRYAWSDVVQVRVRRFAHWRQDCSGLELEFPAGEPTAFLGKCPGRSRCNWTGADARVVLAYLRRYVGEERVQFTASTGPPRTPDEADRRVRDLDRSDREYRKGTRTVYAVFVCFGCLLLFARGGVSRWDAYEWFTAGFVFLGVGLIAAAIGKSLSAARRHVRRKRSELTNWLASYRGESP